MSQIPPTVPLTLYQHVGKVVSVELLAQYAAAGYWLDSLLCRLYFNAQLVVEVARLVSLLKYDLTPCDSLYLLHLILLETDRERV